MTTTQLNMAVADLAQLLLEAALRHGEFEAVDPGSHPMGLRLKGPADLAAVTLRECGFLAF